MRDIDQWIIVDTETTGLRNPIYPIEIAAQCMKGWEPYEESFRVLINFDVPIEPMAEKIHGYSRDYLRKYGISPKDALAKFLDYARGFPVVCYNLTYDWNRVLFPTLERVGLHNLPQVGFCALNLTRHVVPTLPDFKLKTVIKTFGIAKEQSHHANDDVKLTIEFISRYLGPHFNQHNVLGFDNVVACAEGTLAIPPLEPVVLDKKEKKPKTKDLTTEETLFSIGELVGICRALNFDKKLTDDELNFLADWLERCPCAGVYPASLVFDLMREIVSDGVVTSEERQRLSQVIEELVVWRPSISVSPKRIK